MRGTSLTAGSLSRKQMDNIYQESRNVISFGPLISLSGVYSKIITRILHRDMYGEPYHSIFLIKKNWKILMSIEEMIKYVLLHSPFI